MKTLLHVGLWILLSIELVVGIKCHNCLFKKPHRNCIVRQRPCNLYIGQACYKKTIYFGCTPKCIDIYEAPQDQNITQIITCCAHRNFCNA